MKNEEWTELDQAIGERIATEDYIESKSETLQEVLADIGLSVVSGVDPSSELLEEAGSRRSEIEDMKANLVKINKLIAELEG